MKPLKPLSTLNRGRVSGWLQLSLLALALATPATAGAQQTSGQGVSQTSVDQAAGGYEKRLDVRRYIRELVRNHKFSYSQLIRDFAGAKRMDDILETISRPVERTLDWSGYRKIFIVDKRIDGGVDFMKQHWQDLREAERRYGVDAEIISAIIGVETLYGRIKGRHSSFSSLVTLAFDYPPRAKFFRGQLTELLLLAREEGWDLGAVRGSYASALGIPQFIPGSYRAYAIDFDGDGKRDLINNPSDAIGSVANYLAVHGWKPRMPILERVQVKNNRYRRLLKPRELKPWLSRRQLERAGIAPRSGKGPYSLMSLNGDDGEENWVGHYNFYVITRYNHSHLYGMAVVQLADEIARSFGLSLRTSGDGPGPQAEAGN